MEHLQTALLLLGVGMITVFSILGLVVLSGRSLIAIVNRLSSSAEAKDIPGPDTEQPSELAAVIAAVAVLTGGQGRIERIEKL